VFSNSANAATVNSNNKPEQAQTSNTTSKEVFLVSKEEKLKSFENKGTLTDLELKELLYLVGFRGRNLVEAWAVAKKETNGQPIKLNPNAKTGDNSWGLFQINMIGMLGPDRRDKFELVTNSDLLNPVINAQIAFHMSNGGEDWSSWHGLTPRTRYWMTQFPN
ncbi:MAG: hypothetical protein ACKOXF_07055, partial [Chitinophagaceae bacterium]